MEKSDGGLGSIFNARRLLDGQGARTRRTAQSEKVAADFAGLLDKAGQFREHLHRRDEEGKFAPKGKGKGKAAPLHPPSDAERMMALDWIGDAWKRNWDKHGQENVTTAFAEEARAKIDGIKDPQRLLNFADSLEYENHHELAAYAMRRLRGMGYGEGAIPETEGGGEGEPGSDPGVAVQVSAKTAKLMGDALRTMASVAEGRDDAVAERARSLLRGGSLWMDEERSRKARQLLDQGMRMADAAARASEDGNPPAWAADFSEAIEAYEDDREESQRQAETRAFMETLEPWGEEGRFGGEVPPPLGPRRRAKASGPPEPSKAMKGSFLTEGEVDKDGTREGAIKGWETRRRGGVKHEGRDYFFNENTGRWHDIRGEPVTNRGLHDALNAKRGGGAGVEWAKEDLEWYSIAMGERESGEAEAARRLGRDLSMEEITEEAALAGARKRVEQAEALANRTLERFKGRLNPEKEGFIRNEIEVNRKDLARVEELAGKGRPQAMANAVDDAVQSADLMSTWVVSAVHEMLNREHGVM